jgi:hypothetical protein
VVRIERLQLLVCADKPGRADPVLAPEWVARLVDPLICAQRGMILERGDDLRQ